MHATATLAIRIILGFLSSAVISPAVAHGEDLPVGGANPLRELQFQVSVLNVKTQNTPNVSLANALRQEILQAINLLLKGMGAQELNSNPLVARLQDNATRAHQIAENHARLTRAQLLYLQDQLSELLEKAKGLDLDGNTELKESFRLAQINLNIRLKQSEEFLKGLVLDRILSGPQVIALARGASDLAKRLGKAIPLAMVGAVALDVATSQHHSATDPGLDSRIESVEAK